MNCWFLMSKITKNHAVLFAICQRWRKCARGKWNYHDYIRFVVCVTQWIFMWCRQQTEYSCLLENVDYEDDKPLNAFRSRTMWMRITFVVWLWFSVEFEFVLRWIVSSWEQNMNHFDHPPAPNLNLITRNCRKRRNTIAWCLFFRFVRCCFFLISLVEKHSRLSGSRRMAYKISNVKCFTYFLCVFARLQIHAIGYRFILCRNEQAVREKRMTFAKKRSPAVQKNSRRWINWNSFTIEFWVTHFVCFFIIHFHLEIIFERVTSAKKKKTMKQKASNFRWNFDIRNESKREKFLKAHAKRQLKVSLFAIDWTSNQQLSAKEKKTFYIPMLADFNLKNSIKCWATETMATSKRKN